MCHAVMIRPEVLCTAVMLIIAAMPSSVRAWGSALCRNFAKSPSWAAEAASPKSRQRLVRHQNLSRNIRFIAPLSLSRLQSL